jgi:thiamine-phosphate pyrophosphorylase
LSDCSLYLVSPTKIILDQFIPQLIDAFSIGIVKAFQLRLKEADDKTILQAAKEILPICQKHEIAFIINDRADLVVKANADGVHLGQDDMSVADARNIIGSDRIIGVSCHASRDMGFMAGEQGADYVAFGAFFPTKSKSQEKIDKWGVPEIELIEYWSTYTTVPCVAIGGMAAQNCKPLIKAGADFIAAITSVWEHKDGAKQAVQEFYDTGLFNK